jgi:hypothetical protein
LFECGSLATPEPVRNASLLALVAILVDIHNLVDVFEQLQGDSSGASLVERQVFNDPYTPFSLTNETRLLRSRLQKALDIWAESYSASSSSDTMVLFYFCRMYLSLTTLQNLPVLAN